MVKRWKDETKLALILLVCSACGGYFGARMAQVDAPKATITAGHEEFFGSLPPAEANPPVILIVVNDSNRSVGQPSRAVYQQPQPLNPVQDKVNFI